MAATLGPAVNSRQAVRALQRGAARGLAAVLHARHPNLSFEVTIPGDVDRQTCRIPRRSAAKAGEEES